MKIKICKSCDACKIIYRRFGCGYDYSIANGERYYCTVREEMIEPESASCEKFRRKQRKEIDLSPQRFDEAEKAVIFLREHLKDSY